MRKKFREFYTSTKEEIAEYWKTALFSIDANVLLNLYRYSESTQTEILDTFTYLANENRLWISYQVAFEYQKNRLTVIDNTIKTYDNLSEELKKKAKEIESVINGINKHPYLKKDELNNIFSAAFGKIYEEVKKLKETHPSFFDVDPIFNKLTDIFENRIGDELSKEELNIIYKEGKERYEKNIPPGYMDKKDKEKSGEQSLYGDLIIWKELIKRMKEIGTNLIFITDDLKEDWWYKFHGKTIYPRPELLKEFYQETKNEIIIYKPEQFLQFFKEQMKKEIKEETLKEVEEVRKNDEISSYTRYFANKYIPSYSNFDTRNHFYYKPNRYTQIKKDQEQILESTAYAKLMEQVKLLEEGSNYAKLMEQVSQLQESGNYAKLMEQVNQLQESGNYAKLMEQIRQLEESDLYQQLKKSQESE